MTDSNEIEALKASLRGVLTSAQALAPLAARVDQHDATTEMDSADLEELARLSLAQAIAAQALRGLVNTMLTRRGIAASS